LALLRIVVPAMILICPETRHAPALAAAPAALRVVPEGLGWFAAHVPVTPGFARLVQGVCVFSALCTGIGVSARAAAAVMTAAAFYLFALSQFAGAVWHDMHLLWMGALLAASPCDEALAYDRRGAPPSPDSTRYGWPLFWARLLLGCIYFFPGVHKLATSGLAWALSDNLRNQMWWKWAEHGTAHPLRVDRIPGLLQAGGLFVLAFEISFPVLVFVRRIRPWLALAGVVFHLLAGALFRIPFLSLWALYVVLIDPRGFRRMPAPTEPPPPSAHRAAPIATGVVGAALLFGAVVQGVRGQMRAYPFACYPTFQWRVDTEMPDLLIDVEDADGRHSSVVHARDRNGYRSQRQWGEIWSLAGVTAPVNRERLRAYFEQVRRAEPAHSIAWRAVRARFYRAHLSVVPEERGLAPRRVVLLLDLPLTPL
jgi:hypothetical protein